MQRQEGSDGVGTGFIVYPGKTLVTNHHVIEDAKRIVVETYWGQQVSLNQLRAIDEAADIAILPLPAGFPKGGLQPSKRTHAIGESVFAVGSPRDTAFALTAGKLAQFGFRREKSTISADLTTQPGSSGSPLVDRNGNVLGVIHSAAQLAHITLATHVRELKELVKESEGKPFKSIPIDSSSDAASETNQKLDSA